MAADPELLADFLAEAGELLDGLEADVLGLEHDTEPARLNAVFRAFHTVKGGAGFMELDAVVDVCHRAEELCNGLRSGSYAVTAEMVDALSAALETLQLQLDAVQAGEPPPPADPGLLAALKPPGTRHTPAPVLAPVPVAAPSSAEEKHVTDAAVDPTEAAVSDWLAGMSPPAAASPAAGEDTITEDEFEALLDQLHGEAPPAPVAVVAPPESPPVDTPASTAAPSPARVQSPPKAAETSVRVETRRLDRVMNLVGELVLARNRLKARRSDAASSELDKAISALDGVTSSLQLSVMQIRMQPVGRVFARFPKIVRDLARKLGKEVEVELVGEDTELDKNLVESLADPLVHLVRNAVDHGIEDPTTRQRMGKSRAGRLTISAVQAGDHILVSIADDGAGIDANVLRAKAVERQVIDRETAARMDIAECLRIIFMPGFSTRDAVSDVSGRGVGMDVVKSAIESLAGQVEIVSEPGRGTTMEIRVPLTLAILPTLMASVGPRIIGFPLATVGDVIALDPARMRVVENRRVLMLPDAELPIHDLGEWLGCRPHEATRHVVIVGAGGERRGLIVDAVQGREEVVIKPLGALLEDIGGLSGAAVTGDGAIALILEVNGLLKVLADMPSSGIVERAETERSETVA